MLMLLLMLLLLPAVARAQTYGTANVSAMTTGHLFIDGNLGADCTTGNYSIANRACNGSDGNVRNTLAECEPNTTAGQTCPVRAGTY